MAAIKRGAEAAGLDIAVFSDKGQCSEGEPQRVPLRRSSSDVILDDMLTDRMAGSTWTPEIKAATRRDYEAAGVGELLSHTLCSLRDTLALAEDDRTVLSSLPVVDVLTGLPYDPDDTVYVLWRADHRANFWTQARKAHYLEHLRARAAEHGGAINQTRVMVFDDSQPAGIATPDNILPQDHMYFSLVPLHNTGTFLSAPASTLIDYPDLRKLVFGFTLSSRHGYAVISIPFAEGLDLESLATSQVGDYLEEHRNYDEADGPMRAVVTVNRPFVASLLEQTQALLHDERLQTQ